ncbi:MAG: hypothetical protein GY696_04095, partial [Gammaproteobacteria bacterium]|nr:hypothetical protein [Gammaproteobacteria bacterium]
MEREKSKGKGWFDLPATEMTEERKRDLEIVQMRDSLDPKNFYKSNDRNVLPKYFQVHCREMAKQLNLRLLGAPPPDPGRLRSCGEAAGVW